LKDLEFTALQLNATLAHLYAVLGSTDVEYDFDLGKQIYEQGIEKGRILGQLSGDRSESDFASALEQGFRSAGWMSALTKLSKSGKCNVKLGARLRTGLLPFMPSWAKKIRPDPHFSELMRKVGLPQNHILQGLRFR
jgi:hypothetical protein